MAKTITDHLLIAKRLVSFLDTQFNFLGFKFGLDPVLSIIPGLGSFIGTIASLYLFIVAYNMGVKRSVYLKMAGNIILDFLLGAIPVLGIFFDLVYKANVRNLKLLEAYKR